MATGEQPWFHTAIELLDVRRQDRVIAIDADVAQARALRALVGSTGSLTLVHHEAAQAEAFAGLSWPGLRVHVRQPDPATSYGDFDALLIAPGSGPLLTPRDHAAIAHANLRPGGRFVIDLPAPVCAPDLETAWRDLGFADERLELLRGPTAESIVEALAATGLRNVRQLLGAHLVPAANPAEYVACFHAALQLSDDEARGLADAVARRRGGIGPLEALWHRTRVAGQR
jgi:hypothetical protein